MGRNVVMVHGFTRSVSRAWSLVRVVYHTATSYAMQLSMLKVVCPTPPHDGPSPSSYLQQAALCTLHFQ